MSVTFHPFNRWIAFAIDGLPSGYMSHFDGLTILYLKKDANKWLRDVRERGPFESNNACQAAIKTAFLNAYAAPPLFAFGANVLKFPDSKT